MEWSTTETAHAAAILQPNKVTRKKFFGTQIEERREL